MTFRAAFLQDNGDTDDHFVRASYLNRGKVVKRFHVHKNTYIYLYILIKYYIYIMKRVYHVRMHIITQTTEF